MPRPIRLFRYTVAAAVVVASCALGPRRYSTVTTVRDRQLTAGISIESTWSTTRDVRCGSASEVRRYTITITVADRRPAVLVIHDTGQEPYITREALDHGLAGAAMRVSPDGLHFALQLGPHAGHGGGRVRTFHLLPNGAPLYLESLDERLDINTLTGIDWTRIAEPAQLAREAILAQRGIPPEEYGLCRTSQPPDDFTSRSNLEAVVEDNMAVSAIGDAVLQLWPDCGGSSGGTWSAVAEHVKSGHASPDWLGRLRAKIAEQLTRPRLPTETLVMLIDTCRHVVAPNLLNDAYRVAVWRWPFSDYMDDNNIFEGRVNDLQPEVKAELVARARRALAVDEGPEYVEQHARSILAEAGKQSGK